MSYNCPICDKGGLPDYKKVSAVCPQCNSDLRPFLLLHSMSAPQRVMTGIYIIIGISLLTVGILGISYLKSSSSQQELIVRNEALKDSLINLRMTAIATAAPETTNPTIEPKGAIVRYVVKKGDYPYKIAQFFYGDGGRFRQIESDNNLTNPYSLKIGQVLTIKIVQE